MQVDSLPAELPGKPFIPPVIFHKWPWMDNRSRCRQPATEQVIQSSLACKTWVRASRGAGSQGTCLVAEETPRVWPPWERCPCCWWAGQSPGRPGSRLATARCRGPGCLLPSCWLFPLERRRRRVKEICLSDTRPGAASLEEPSALMTGMGPESPSYLQLPRGLEWERTCLPKQETWVPSLVGEDPTCLRATKPVSHKY